MAETSYKPSDRCRLEPFVIYPDREQLTPHAPASPRF
jgi:hypothetical protein